MTFDIEYDTYDSNRRWYDSDDDDPVSDYSSLLDYYSSMSVNYYTLSKKSAIALLRDGEDLLQGVIVQHGKRFYVFVKNPNLGQFTGNALVNEIIPKQRLRYPTVDIDSKVPSRDDLIEYFSVFIDDKYDLVIFETTRGYHVLVKSALLNFDEHRDFINKVAEDNPT